MAKGIQEFEIHDEIGVMDAIYKLRAVRHYLKRPVTTNLINCLVDAAVHAPTAMHEEPWVFTVIQNRDVLRDLSEDAKRLAMKEIRSVHAPDAKLLAQLEDPKFNVFYNAETLIVIWGKPMGPFVEADCWLAAENFMLAACAKGLGTCVIGLAVGALNSPGWRKKFNLHEKMVAFAPIIVGFPDGVPAPVARKPPEIFYIS